MNFEKLFEGTWWLNAPKYKFRISFVRISSQYSLNDSHTLNPTYFSKLWLILLLLQETIGLWAYMNFFKHATKGLRIIPKWGLRWNIHQIQILYKTKFFIINNFLFYYCFDYRVRVFSRQIWQFYLLISKWTCTSERVVNGIRTHVRETKHGLVFI